LPITVISEARQLVRDIDMDDFAFVALANYLNAFLWTGDRVLIDGLRKKGYRNIISTLELIKLTEEKDE
jgi:predicted nucleic acid-binding protein